MNTNKESDPFAALTARFLEACWLVAIVTVPLHFNLGTSRIFEPDKILILRFIAALMLGAWIVRAVGAFVDRRSNRKAEMKHPRVRGREYPWLLIAVGLVAVTMVSSSVFSIAPELSFFGSFVRQQGTITFFAYLTIFGSIARTVKEPGQVDRIITTILLTSVPVSIYGILQHFGTDPIPWGGNSIQRVASTMGNPIFVAAYLIMAIPATLSRVRGLLGKDDLPDHISRPRMAAGIMASATFVILVYSWTLSPRIGTSAAVITILMWFVFAGYLRWTPSRAVSLAVYLTILALQITTILFSQSRGPILGLLAGFSVAGMLFLSVRTRRAVRVRVAVSVLILLVSFLFSLTIAPVRNRLATVPYVGRLANIVVNSSNVKVRTLVWEGTTDLLLNDPVRAVIGYGPETMKFAFPAFYTPELGGPERRDALPDRAHNELYDITESRGVIGLFAYLIMIGALFRILSSLVGLRDHRMDRRRYAFMVTGFTLFVPAVACTWDGSFRLAGPGLALGFFAGLLAYWTVYGVPEDGPRRPSGRAVSLALAAGFAIGAHFIESQTGIGIASTYLYFWVWMGLAWAVHNRVQLQATQTDGTDEMPASGDPKKQFRELDSTLYSSSDVVIGALLTSLAVILLVNNFTLLQGQNMTVAGITWLIALFWVISAAVVIIQPGRLISAQTKRLKSQILFAGITLVCSALYILFHAPSWLPGGQIESQTVMIYVVVTAIIVLLSANLPGASPARWRNYLKPVRLIVVVCLIPLAGWLAYSVGFRPVQADLWYAAGKSISSRSELINEAVLRFGRAVAYQPSEDTYYTSLGRSLLERATAVSPEEGNEDYLSAFHAFRTARRLNPLDVDHQMNVARFLELWSIEVTDPVQRDSLMARSVREFEIGARMVTRMPFFQTELGEMYVRAGNPGRAEYYFRHSLSLDSLYERTYSGLATLYLDQDSLLTAEDLLDSAVRNLPRSKKLSDALKYVRSEIDRIRAEITRFESAIHADPSDIESYQRIIREYLRLEDCRGARLWAEQAALYFGQNPEMRDLQSSVAAACRPSEVF